MFYKKGALRNFAKFLRTPFFQRIPLVAASERVNADEGCPPVFCSCWKGKY